VRLRKLRFGRQDRRGPDDDRARRRLSRASTAGALGQAFTVLLSAFSFHRSSPLPRTDRGRSGTDRQDLRAWRRVGSSRGMGYATYRNRILAAGRGEIDDRHTFAVVGAVEAYACRTARDERCDDRKQTVCDRRICKGRRLGERTPTRTRMIYWISLGNSLRVTSRFEACGGEPMAEDSLGSVWYCVVIRDENTKQCRHYRCLWNRRDAELYKLQLEQQADHTDQSTSVLIETLPAGEMPKKKIS
jgi:hypothetical protein